MDKHIKTEQVLNVVSHAIGAILALLLLAHLKVRPMAVLVMYFGFFVLFIVSCVYHLCERTKFEHVMLRADTSMIAICIAATISAHSLLLPQMLWNERPIAAVIALVWMMAAANIFVTSVWGWNASKWLCTINVLQVLIPFMVCPNWTRALEWPLIEVVAGVAAYGVGFGWFFRQQRGGNYFHFYWHICVLTGFLFHHHAIAQVQ